jgi:hypothetical protein
VEPFLPENLDKVFIKRENKKKNDTEIKIINDSEGLFNYLTAPNIRHKVEKKKKEKKFFKLNFFLNSNLRKIIEKIFFYLIFKLKFLR